MHAPLYQPHPLCKQEVEDFTRCHRENPFMKFLNACGEAELTMNACFREEKKLRRGVSKERRAAVEAHWRGVVREQQAREAAASAAAAAAKTQAAN
jgi:COX assembly protein 2